MKYYLATFAGPTYHGLMVAVKKIMRASLVLFLSDSISVYKLSPLIIIFYNNLKKVALVQSYLGNLNNLLDYTLHLFEMGNTGKD